MEREAKAETRDIETQTPELKEFESKKVEIGNQIQVLFDKIQKARDANNGVLNDKDQINNFITEVEQIMTRYNRNFADLSPKSQAFLQREKARLMEELDKIRQQLVDDLRKIGQPSPAPTAPAIKDLGVWIPRASGGEEYLKEYLSLDLTKVRITPAQANKLKAELKKLIPANSPLFNELARQPDATKRQNAVKETYQAVLEEREEKAKPEPAPFVPPAPKSSDEAMREAREKLQAFVDNPVGSPNLPRGFKSGYTQTVKRALQTIGLSTDEINQISQYKKHKDKQAMIRQYLDGTCRPGGSGRRMSCPLPSSKPKKRIIDTKNYTEYYRLRQQYANDPNVIVQAPSNQPGTLSQQSIQPQITFDTRVPSSIFPEEADLSRSRIKQP